MRLNSWQPYVEALPTGKPMFQVEYPKSMLPCGVAEEEDVEVNFTLVLYRWGGGAGTVEK